MATASARRSSAKARVTATLVNTFGYAKVVTEFWAGKPEGVESHEDPTRPGTFVSTRLFYPEDESSCYPTTDEATDGFEA